MLRVGLTGGLGSGKSTVAAMLRELGAEVLSSDDLARKTMQPGEPVYREIVARFGPRVVGSGGELDRAALGAIAFGDGRIEELEAIVHPAVIAYQAALADELAGRRPDAVLVVESALLFETPHAGPGGWRSRFDRILVVTAPEDLRIDRYLQRSAAATATDRERLRGEARQRLARQMLDEQKAAMADWVLPNGASLDDLRREVTALWPVLAAEAQTSRTT